MRSREEKRQSIQGFNPAEEVVPTSVCGSPSPCHPELVSGSLFFLRGGWRTVDGERCLHSVQRVFVLKRPAGLRTRF